MNFEKQGSAKLAVQFSDVYFSYETASQDWALENVSVEINQGEFAGIIGPNGAGKSTFVKLMLGIYQPVRGEVKVFGSNPCHKNSRKKIGYVPQFNRFRQGLPMSVREMVLMGGQNFSLFYKPSKVMQEKCDSLLAEFDCRALATKKVSSLSGGELQRCLLARALMSDPDLIVLDEPTASVDPGGEKNIFEHLKKYKSQKTIFVVSHDYHFITSYIDKLICVRRQVFQHDSLHLENNQLDQLYGHKVQHILHDHS